MSEKLRYREARLDAVLKEHKRRREDLVSLLRALPQVAWQRTGLRPKLGEQTIEGLAASSRITTTSTLTGSRPCPANRGSPNRLEFSRSRRCASGVVARGDPRPAFG